MGEGRTRPAFVGMLREEWRLHARLFGGRRFAAFPLLVAIIVAGAVAMLVTTGTAVEAVFAGLHGLTFVFGLHTGSIGLLGRDALHDLLGETTLLVFSARTLPISRRRLLAVFVAKDVLYYALLFLLPMAVATVPAVLAVGPSLGVLATVTTAGRLWMTLTGTFVLGLGTTITLLGLADRGIPGLAVIVTTAGAGTIGWLAGVPVLAVTPYGVFLEPSIGRVVGATALVGSVLVAGGVTFRLEVRRRTRTVDPSYRTWTSRLGDPIATKTLLDVHRSAGGFGKVLFSAVVLLGVAIVLVDVAGDLTGLSPSMGVSLGAILGLSGFTTYNWLTQVDDLDVYGIYPIDAAAVFRAKFTTFLLLGPAVALAAYLPAVAWHGGPIPEALAGAVVLVGVTCYIFGVTVHLAGLSPNEFLFDAGLFAVFGVAMIVALVPILVVGLTLAPLPVGLLAGVALWGVGLGVGGLGLYRLGTPRWTERYRR